MATVEAEYAGFMDYLAGVNVDADVLRLAKIVGKNLPHLSEVGATRRARSTRLAPLAIEGLLVTTPDLEGAEGKNANPAIEHRLANLVVGPFRGFMRPETFDLSSDITLIYGPNGTGKSSFCEALEFAMLGSISEAQAKRADPRAYCNNARLRRHTPPLLTAVYEGGRTATVAADEGLYRFCFVEKNRLDDFARIAARTPSDQRQLIATLFGIDNFSEFVRGFNASLDESLVLWGSSALTLDAKRAQLATSQHTVAAFPAAMALLDAEGLTIALRYGPGLTYNEVRNWLLGTTESVGRLPVLQGQLDAGSPKIYGVRVQFLQDRLSTVQRVWGELDGARRALLDRATDVSYRQLYEAVGALAATSNSCPACGTDLAHVASNPFVRAQAGLQQLAELATLQELERALSGNLSQARQELWSTMNTCVAALRESFPDEAVQAGYPALGHIPAGDWLSAWLVNDRAPWVNLLAAVARIEELDQIAAAANAGRAQAVVERDALQRTASAMENLEWRKSQLESQLQEAQKLILEFEQNNAALVEQVEKEKLAVAYHQRVKVAYDRFLPLLQNYLSSLPGTLILGLGELAKNLYNAFNRGDHPSDLLHALWLPIAENGKIEVEFKSQPGVRYDALLIFSEGHIRCLGLSILLAKNISQNCPFVIFDDVVNAIDDDHRDGILRTFFQDAWLTGKQILLTSHAEEFLQRIQQEIGAERARQTKRYKFLGHTGEHELRVDSEPPTKNYVLLANDAIRALEKRDALRHARPGLESVTDQLWKWMGGRGDGRLELKLAAPKAPIELNNKCLKLKTALARLVPQYPPLASAVAALEDLLNVSGTSLEWGYLNGAVHDSERTHEFDSAIATRVVAALTQLDASLAQVRRGA